MKLKTIPVLLFLFSAIVFIGCSDSNDPMAEVRYSFEINKTANKSAAKTADFSANNTEAARVEFTSGFITIREIVFDGDMGGGKSISITHEEVAKIDIATGNVTPSLETVQIPAGTYRSVNLGIELQDVNDEPQVLLNGAYTDTTGAEIPLRFEFNSGEVFEANASQITLSESRVATAQIAFDPIFWFSVVTSDMLDEATRNANGVIVISETSNPEIFDAVADQLDVATQATFN